MSITRSIHPLPGEAEHTARLSRLIDAFGGRRVVVIGDIIADEFIYGQIARVSREAPVLILRYDSTQVVAGGAGNAANNVAALGGRAGLVGLVGPDEIGRRLTSSLHRLVERGGMLRPSGCGTPTKTRILAGGIHSAKQQIVRIDREPGVSLDARTRQDLGRRVMAAVSGADAVIVSDYGYGLVSPALAADVRQALDKRSRRRRVPILVDSRYELLGYRGLAACTPNESEVEQLLGIRINDDLRVLERAGRAILKRTRMQAVLVTRGSRGMALFQPGVRTVHLPIYGSDEIADVTGAGDTVIATMALGLACGGSFDEAARLANYAGGLVVMKRGTATVTADELRAAVIGEHAAP